MSDWAQFGTGENPLGLELAESVWSAMLEHARDTMPEECCGLLAGSGRRATVIYPLENADHSPWRYSAEPRGLIAAFRDMRKRGLELTAIYHSHPTAPPVPSRTDLEENYYGLLPRVIVSLQTLPPTVRAFLLYEDRWREIPLVVVADEQRDPNKID